MRGIKLSTSKVDWRWDMRSGIKGENNIGEENKAEVEARR